MKILIALNKAMRPQIIGKPDYQRLTSLGNVLPVEPPEKADKEFLLKQPSDTEIIISSWGTNACFDAEIMAHYPRLKLLAHAAGSVKSLVSEALWKNIAVVGGNTGGIPLQMVNGVGGFLVDTTEECADRVLYLLNHKDEAREMALRGHERVRDHFLITRYLAETLSLLQSMAEARPSRPAASKPRRRRRSA